MERMSEPANNLPQPVESATGQNVPALSSVIGATPRPVFMPETFTGAGREWCDWAKQFEMAADVNNWDDSLRLKCMVSYCLAELGRFIVGCQQQLKLIKPC